MLYQNKSFNFLILTRLFINIADSLFYIITIWYVSSVSPVMAGIAVFCFTLPESFLIFIGPLIDRINAKKLLLFSVVSQIALLAILLILIRLNAHIILFLIIIFVSAFMSSITYPIEETMVPQIVKKNELVAANSIVDITYKIANFLFNGVSGLLISIFSIVTLYQLNIFLFAIPIVFIILINFKNTSTNNSELFNLKTYKNDLKEGIIFFSTEKV